MAAATGASAAKELEVTRVFNAPRELVFDAWTDCKQLSKWWGPSAFTTPFCKIDARPGGVIHVAMRGPDGREYWNKGVFREVKKPERLVFTLGFSDAKGSMTSAVSHGLTPDFPDEVLTTVTFEDQNGKTKVTMRQSLPESIALKNGAREGWTQSFVKLAALVEK